MPTSAMPAATAQIVNCRGGSRAARGRVATRPYGRLATRSLPAGNRNSVGAALAARPVHGAAGPRPYGRLATCGLPAADRNSVGAALAARPVHGRSRSRAPTIISYPVATPSPTAGSGSQTMSCRVEPLFDSFTGSVPRHLSLATGRTCR